MYVYRQSETPQETGTQEGLHTVGFYDPDGVWQPESDHATKEAAARRCAWLNGGPGRTALDAPVLSVRVISDSIAKGRAAADKIYGGRLNWVFPGEGLGQGRWVGSLDSVNIVAEVFIE